MENNTIRTDEKKKCNPGFYVLMIGVVLSFVDISVVTLSSYGFEHVQAEGGNRFFYKEFLKKLMGEGVTLDIFIRLAGYLVLIAGCLMLKKYHKRFQLSAILSVAAGISYTAYTCCPFYADGSDAIKLAVGLLIVWLVCQSAVLFNLYMAIQKQVDSFYHIEVRKDLYFGFETVVLCLIASKVMRVLYWLPFGSLVYYALCIGMHAGIVYFVVKAIGSRRFWMSLQEK